MVSASLEKLATLRFSAQDAVKFSPLFSSIFINSEKLFILLFTASILGGGFCVSKLFSHSLEFFFEPKRNLPLLLPQPDFLGDLAA